MLIIQTYLLKIVNVYYCVLSLDGYTTDELQFEWREFLAVQVNENLELPQFKLIDFVIVDCQQSYITGKRF